MGHDLAEPAKTDNQHRTTRIGEVLGLTKFCLCKPAQQPIGECGHRWTEQHGDGGNGGENARLARIEHAERAAEWNEHERELAGAGENRSGA